MDNIDDKIKKANDVITLTEREALDLKIVPGVTSAAVIVVLAWWQNNGVEVLVTKELQGSDIIIKIPGGMVKADDVNFFETAKRETREEIKAKVAVKDLEYVYGWQAKNTSETSTEKHYKLCVLAKEFSLNQQVATKDLATDTDILDRFFVPFGELEIATDERKAIPYTQQHCLPYVAEALVRLNSNYMWPLFHWLKKLDPNRKNVA
jgi:ADP-ribose pyrophosphatase YjhB (NUDIX family)